MSYLVIIVQKHILLPQIAFKNNPKTTFLIYYKNGLWKPIKSEVRQLNVFSN